jgi:hypothetical protein
MEINTEQLEKLLIAKGKKIEPPVEPLKAVLARLPDVVTNQMVSRYQYLENKGRKNNIFININNFMSQFTKKILPVGLVAVAVIAIGYWYFGSKVIAPKQTPSVTLESIVFDSPEVNQTVNEIIDSAVNGDELLSDESIDLYFVDYENEASVNINNIAYIYEQ